MPVDRRFVQPGLDGRALILLEFFAAAGPATSDNVQSVNFGRAGGTGLRGQGEEPGPERRGYSHCTGPRWHSQTRGCGERSGAENGQGVSLRSGPRPRRRPYFPWAALSSSAARGSPRRPRGSALARKRCSAARTLPDGRGWDGCGPGKAETAAQGGHTAEFQGARRAAVPGGPIPSDNVQSVKFGRGRGRCPGLFLNLGQLS